MTSDAVLSMAIAALTLVGGGSLLVAWRALTRSERWADRYHRADARARHAEARLREWTVGPVTYSGGPAPSTPSQRPAVSRHLVDDATRPLRVVPRDAT